MSLNMDFIFIWNYKYSILHTLALLLSEVYKQTFFKNICKHIHFIFISWCKRSMQSVTNIQMGIHSSQRPNIMYFIICKRHPVFPSLQSTYLMNFSAIRQCSLFPLFQIIRNAKLVVARRKPVSPSYTISKI